MYSIHIQISFIVSTLHAHYFIAELNAHSIQSAYAILLANCTLAMMLDVLTACRTLITLPARHISLVQHQVAI